MGVDGTRTDAPLRGVPPAQPASVGALLRLLRERAGLSQEALAERAGLGVSTLKALERGRRQRPHPQTLVLLADALGPGPTERALLFELATAAPVVPNDCASGRRAPEPAGQTAPVRLPRPPTMLIGREADVAEVSRLLDPTTGSARLLTLVGPGGIGKTRLALAVAETFVDAYADGTTFVDLAPLRDARLVPATVARALGLHDSGRSAHELLLESLRDRQVLLVLDNFEHLLAAATLLAEVLQECPRVTLLVTSRTALRLRVERRLLVRPLATPAADCLSPDAVAASPAVRLFVERARAVAPDFALHAGTAAVVGTICRRLDGLPLAIELAAARTVLLSPPALLDRLERRLAVLDAGASDLPERQRALRQTLAWSYDLLGPVEKPLFRRLAVFTGGWTLPAAEAVCADATLTAADVLDRLQALMDNSLVQRTSDPSGEPRFEMLQTVRDYAQELLESSDEADAQRSRHAIYFVVLAEQAEPELQRADQRVWLDRLDDELDNLRAVLAWAHSSGELELGLRFATALVSFYKDRGYVTEGRVWLQTLMHDLTDREASAQLLVLRARALATMAWLGFLQGDFEGAAPLAEESLTGWQQLGEVGNSSLALNTLAYVADRQGNVARRDELFRQSLALCQMSGDRRGSAEVLSWLGTQQRAAGDLDGATNLLDHSLRLYEATGTVTGIAYVQLHLGGVAAARGDPSRAQALFEHSRASSDDVGDRGGSAYAMGALAALAAEHGELVEARSQCLESIAMFRHLGDARGMAEELRLLGRIGLRQGDDLAAVAAFAECLHLRRAHSEVASTFCLEGVALALGHLGTGDQHPARLQIATRLLGAASVLRDRLGNAPNNLSVSMPRLIHPELADAVGALRTVLGEAAFAAAWTEGTSLTLDNAVAQALALARHQSKGASDSRRRVR